MFQTNALRPVLIIEIFIIFVAWGVANAGNIDPDTDGHKYAWGENIGWIDFEPAEGPGVTVTDTDVTGDAWGENTGWIVLDLINDGDGNLSGCAWGENVGWISFSCDTTDCDTVSYGIAVDPVTGEFSGNAWGENIGWISFDYAGSDASGVKTSWGAIITCDGDFNVDGDVDGSDLATSADDQSLLDLSVFAANFGKDDCLE